MGDTSVPLSLVRTLLTEQTEVLKTHVDKCVEDTFNYKKLFEEERAKRCELSDMLINMTRERDEIRTRVEVFEREEKEKQLDQQHHRDVPALRGAADEKLFFESVEGSAFVGESGMLCKRMHTIPRSGDLMLQVPLPGSKTHIRGLVDKKSGSKTNTDLYKLVRDVIHTESDFGILVYNTLPPSFHGWVDFSTCQEKIDVERLSEYLTKEFATDVTSLTPVDVEWSLPNMTCFIACEPHLFYRAVTCLIARASPVRGPAESNDVLSEQLMCIATLHEEMQNMFDFLYGGLKQDRLRVRVESLRKQLVGAKRKLLEEGPYLKERRHIYDQVKRMHERDVFAPHPLS